MRIVIGFRASIALAATLVITFTRPDTAALALALFAGFGLLSGLGSLAIGLIGGRAGALNVTPQGAIAILAAASALWALATSPLTQLAFFKLIVLTYLLLNTVFEAYLGRSVGLKTVEGREHLIAAGLALLFSIIYVVLNPEPLNAAGFLGAYFALSAVHQGIWAASPTKAD